MPLTMPMWPPIFAGAPTRAMPAPPIPAVAALPVRRRWMIDDDNVRREVPEREYRQTLASCDRIEVARYAHEDVVTHVCYRKSS